MAIVIEQPVAPLRAGDNLTRDEFLRRWQAAPSIKSAELIGGKEAVAEIDRLRELHKHELLKRGVGLWPPLGNLCAGVAARHGLTSRGA
ncbi:MAG TPA: hypothetical protein VF278_08010 [Pirellulales bacterium]